MSIFLFLAAALSLLQEPVLNPATYGSASSLEDLDRILRLTGIEEVARPSELATIVSVSLVRPHGGTKS